MKKNKKVVIKDDEAIANLPKLGEVMAYYQLDSVWYVEFCADVNPYRWDSVKKMWIEIKE